MGRGWSVNPPLIYIAGPYRAPTAWGRERNIHEARRFGVMVARAGGYPVIPHSNTAHFDGEAPDELWLAGTLELMWRCDAVLLMPRWEESIGARTERAEALRLALPVVSTTGEGAGDVFAVAGFIRGLVRR